MLLINNAVVQTSAAREIMYLGISSALYVGLAPPLQERGTSKIARYYNNVARPNFRHIMHTVYQRRRQIVRFDNVTLRTSVTTRLSAIAEMATVATSRVVNIGDTKVFKGISYISVVLSVFTFDC
jgi:hypothetical protein